MDDKFIIAIIAAGATILGVAVSAILSFVLGIRSEKQKIALSSAEYLRHKIQMLEKSRENLLAEGRSVQVNKSNIHDLLAKAAEESLGLGSLCLTRIAHYLPPAVAAELHEERDHLQATIAHARGEYHGLSMQDDPSAEKVVDGSDIVRRMAGFSGWVAQAIDSELVKSVDHINNIYQL